MRLIRRQKVAMAFGRVLREERRARGLSQEELASRGDFDRTYPSLLERGLRTPTLTAVFRLADVLGISASTLVAKAFDERASTRLDSSP
jgi:transcriptional regulator with XRE-family HTH domain